MIPPSKKTINRQPEQGSISLLEEIQKKCNQSLTNSTCVNSNNISYETPSMNNLTSFYMKEDANKFMKKIDKLNLNFMILSDKYLKHQKEVEKVKDNLFINLFKQISLYVEEIERLNIKIKDKEGSCRCKEGYTYSIKNEKCELPNASNKSNDMANVLNELFNQIIPSKIEKKESKPFNVILNGDISINIVTNATNSTINSNRITNNDSYNTAKLINKV